MKCVAATCAASYAECGGPGRQTLLCCESGFSCSKMANSATTKCMPVTKLLSSVEAVSANTAQCVPLSGECGGPGRKTLSCCQGECKPEIGGVMKCVAATCAASYAECGGPGRQALPCCESGFSCSKIPNSAVTKCMPITKLLSSVDALSASTAQCV